MYIYIIKKFFVYLRIIHIHLHYFTKYNIENIIDFIESILTSIIRSSATFLCFMYYRKIKYKNVKGVFRFQNNFYLLLKEMQILCIYSLFESEKVTCF